jgi:uncharacterized protein YecT (DUF1311 family)
MRRALAGLLVSALVAGPAAAAPPADPWESPAYKACMKTAASTLAMRECNGGELGRRDAELNEAYRQLIGLMDTPKRTAALRKAQRAWIGFRDAECPAEASSHVGGTVWPLAVGSCHIRMTYERTLQLRDLLKTGRSD